MNNKKIKIICFDLDNVLCATKKSLYKKSKPIKKAIDLVNTLYAKGFYIKIFTSRFMGRNNDKVSKAKKQGYKFTKKQLLSWHLKYHTLIFGKPSYDLFIDDKNLSFKKNWVEILKKKF
jgi:FMN phosphatase YigB (HAD superfamily)